MYIGFLLSLVFAVPTVFSNVLSRYTKRLTLEVGDTHAFTVNLDGKRILVNGSLALHWKGRWYHSQDLDNGLIEISRSSSKGTDQFGDFKGTYIGWSIANIEYEYTASDQIVLETIFREYDRGDLILFEQRYPIGVQGTQAKSTENRNPFCQFPSFDIRGNLTSLGWTTWRGTSSPASGVGISIGQAPYSSTPANPVALYDQLHQTIVVSPLTNFKVAASYAGNDNSWKMGVSSMIPSVPSNFSHITVLLAGDGVTATLEKWGREIIQGYYGTDRKESIHNDISMNYLGYWTDNGAYYNMNKWIGNKNLPYDPLSPLSSPETLLLEEITSLQSHGIPVRYMQLDDWYYKGYVTLGAVGCVRDWTARTDWFPHGLKWLSEKLNNFPFFFYVPWFCSDTIYSNETNGTSGQFAFVHSKFVNGGVPGGGPNGSIGSKCPWPLQGSKVCSVANAQPAPSNSFEFYSMLFRLGKSMGMSNFEQDFVGSNGNSYGWPTCLSCAEEWLTGMARAAESEKVPMQYCLASASDLMLSTKFPYVTNSRASGDYAGCVGWDIGTSGMLHWVLNIGPYHDVFWSTARQAGDPYTNTTLMPSQYKRCIHDPDYGQPNVLLDTIVSAFSGGPVGIGDGKGFTNHKYIMGICRADGMILRSAKLFTPIDRMIIKNTFKLVNRTIDTSIFTSDTLRLQTSYTKIADMLWYYILAVDVPTNSGHMITPFNDFYPSPLPSATFAVASPFLGAYCKNGSIAYTNDSCVHKFTAREGFPVSTVPGHASENGTHGVALFVFAPILSSNWVLLGEIDKFVSVSVNRFSSVHIINKCLLLSVEGVKNEVAHIAVVTPAHTVLLVDVDFNSSGTKNVTIC